MTNSDKWMMHFQVVHQFSLLSSVEMKSVVLILRWSYCTIPFTCLHLNIKNISIIVELQDGIKSQWLYDSFSDHNIFCAVKPSLKCNCGRYSNKQSNKSFKTEQVFEQSCAQRLTHHQKTYIVLKYTSLSPAPDSKHSGWPYTAATLCRIVKKIAEDWTFPWHS